MKGVLRGAPSVVFVLVLDGAQGHTCRGWFLSIFHCLDRRTCKDRLGFLFITTECQVLVFTVPKTSDLVRAVLVFILLLLLGWCFCCCGAHCVAPFELADYPTVVS